MISKRSHHFYAHHGAVPTLDDLKLALMAEPQEPAVVGFQVFVADGGEEVGAVTGVDSDGLVVYVENAGHYHVALHAVESVHHQKVILNCAKLSRSLRRAIGHAHDAEVPGL